MTTWQAIASMAPPSSRSAGEGAPSSGSFHRNPAFLSVLRPFAGHLVTGWKWLERKRTQQLSARRLRVAETIQLGEKRFVSILQVDGAQFLIGGAAGNVSLLAMLSTEAGTNAEAAAQAVALTEVSR